MTGKQVKALFWSLFAVMVMYGGMFYISQEIEEQELNAAAEEVEKQRRANEEAERRSQERAKEDANCRPHKSETYVKWASRIRREDKGCFEYPFSGWRNRFSRKDEKRTSTKPPPPCTRWDENTCLEGGDTRWENGKLTGILRNNSRKTLNSIYVEYRCLDRSNTVLNMTNDRMWSVLRPGERWKFQIYCYDRNAYRYQLVEVRSR